MNTNPLTKNQEDALEVLKSSSKGKEITGLKIGIDIGIKRDRFGNIGANVRLIVNALRDKGFLICANSSGYFMPKTPQELSDYIEEFQSRIDEQQKSCDVLRERYTNWSKERIKVLESIKQTTIFGDQLSPIRKSHYDV